MQAIRTTSLWIYKCIDFTYSIIIKFLEKKRPSAPGRRSLRPREIGKLSLLHQDILFEILVRLDHQSLRKLNCVSRFFTDPSFEVSYVNWTTSPIHGTTILFSFQAPFVPDRRSSYYGLQQEEFYTINYNSHEEEGKLIHAKRVRHLEEERLQHLRCVSLAKGVLCFVNSSREYITCDRVTGQHISFPATPRWSKPPADPRVLLGFDGSSRTYKILKSEAWYETCTVKHWVITVRVGEYWREIDESSSPLFQPYSHFSRSVCVDSVIYSYNRTCNIERWERVEGGFYIVAFDLESESFHGMPFPPVERKHYDDFVRNSTLVESDGRLAIIHVCNGMVITWSFEPSSSCWNKKHAIALPPEVVEASRLPRLLDGNKFLGSFSVTPAGEVVLLMPRRRTSSLWILLEKVGVKPIWKKFRISGLGDFPNFVHRSFKAVVVVQNITENFFHRE
ncbi:unnamed protein product [Cuscuta epithymum]|uniref:F-box associated beta-propeller type 3 domain-containing protein n=1 Tax=Cuscuta epithymum TaxID=186058 RepID=A0AAV0G6S9_9ASTE|nr:unnamed protein product [Cuscuta epithymum]